VPATRALAVELKCSRNTVLAAYEQLLSEGYLEGRHGSGTYVSRVLPDTLLAVSESMGRPRAPMPRDSALADPNRARVSHRGAVLAALARERRAPGLAFVPGVPETALFPFDVWGRLLGRVWRRPPGVLLRHGDPGGHRPLREAIARHLGAVRALRCGWRQVLVTTGAQQALDLVARVLLEPGEAVWLEEPGYPGLRGPLVGAGQRAVPVPVDAEGLSVVEGLRRAPGARLAVVTPSHQYPLGIVMSLARRIELLDWAYGTGAWILEDDYDSEYRYAGRPLAALQGLDADRAPGAGRVIYVGTFSKVLFPSLRLGYLVVPPDLAEPMTRARAALDDHPGAPVQPVLAAFLEDGHFAAHVRRMRALYAGRQAALVAALRRRLEGLLDAAPDDSGLHLVARLAPDLAARMDDRAASARAARAGIAAPALSSYFTTEPAMQGLLLGYAAVPESGMAASVERLAAALEAPARAGPA
jgi:GntR family transcriptional regulator/MocR family aminotransferase